MLLNEWKRQYNPPKNLPFFCNPETSWYIFVVACHSNSWAPMDWLADRLTTIGHDWLCLIKAEHTMVRFRLKVRVRVRVGIRISYTQPQSILLDHGRPCSTMVILIWMPYVRSMLGRSWSINRLIIVAQSAPVLSLLYFTNSKESIQIKIPDIPKKSLWTIRCQWRYSFKWDPLAMTLLHSYCKESAHSNWVYLLLYIGLNVISSSVVILYWGGHWGVAKTAKLQQNVPKTANPCPKSLKTKTAMFV